MKINGVELDFALLDQDRAAQKDAYFAVLKDIVKNQDAVLYDSFNEALIDLKSGRIDGLLMDKVYAGYYLKQKNELDQFNMIKGDYQSEDFVVGARKKDKELVKKINEGIAELEKTGEFQQISDKWFGEDVTPVQK